MCPTAVDPEDPRSYYSVSDRLARETPARWKPDQYSNPENPAVALQHHRPGALGRRPTARITHFVAGVGTGGTISGAGRYLKEVSDGRVKIIGADPEGSVYSGGTGRPYLVEGVGEDFWPDAYDRDGLRRDRRGDRPRLVRDDPPARPRGGAARRRLLRHGRRRGAAGRRAADDPDDVVVVLLPDGGRGYLSKVFNDDWMAPTASCTQRRRSRRVGDVLRPQGRRRLPDARARAPARDGARRDRLSCASTRSRRCRSSRPSRR